MRKGEAAGGDNRTGDVEAKPLGGAASFQTLVLGSRMEP